MPANTGRHGGRPYHSTRPKFLFRLDRSFFWPAAGLKPETISFCVLVAELTPSNQAQPYTGSIMLMQPDPEIFNHIKSIGYVRYLQYIIGT